MAGSMKSLQSSTGQRLMMILCMLMLLLADQGGSGVLAEDSGSSTCTVRNKSQKEVTLVAVDVNVDVDPLEVGVGASVQLPPGSYCFQREGHQSPPVSLVGLSLLAIVDGATSGTIDVCVAVDVLGVIELGITLVVGL